MRKETIKLSKKERKRKEEEEPNTSIFFARLKDQGLDPTHYKR